jgi:hypothetical protein
MPEETEIVQPTDGEPDETTDVVDPVGADEPTDGADAPEADKPKPEEPFDAERAKAKIKKANSEAENLRKRLKEQEPQLAELQRLKDADKTESQRLTDQLAAANERIDKTRARLVKSQVQALAGTAVDGRPAFADPEDAVGALDLGSYIDSDGDIDEAAIEADLQALIERKPHWGKPTPLEGPRRPAPDRTQASGANKTRPLAPADEFAGWLTSQLK